MDKIKFLSLIALSITIYLVFLYLNKTNYKWLQKTHAGILHIGKVLKKDKNSKIFKFYYKKGAIFDALKVRKFKLRYSNHNICFVNSKKEFVIDQSSYTNCDSKSILKNPELKGGFVYYPNENLLRLNVKLKNGILRGEQFKIDELDYGYSSREVRVFENNWISRFAEQKAPAYWHLDANKVTLERGEIELLEDILNDKVKL
ncbi:MAG: hypothetical protein KC646_15960 [Candidatus Cloacimonetes bacterium]|nr:hypothetical protein [Candidatus Cloacimonadota bacterium]